jgi:superfamily II DNA or RNA helicase
MISVTETPTRLLLFGPMPELDILKEHYTYQVDGCWHSDLYQLWRRHQSSIKQAEKEGNFTLAESLKQRKVGWDGKRCVMKFSYRQGQLVQVTLPRGHLSDLIDFSIESGIELNTEKVLPNPFASVTLDDIPDNLLAVELNQEQWEIQKPLILEWLTHGMSRIKVTVSGGKTAMFCAAAAFVKKRFPKARFLYITPAERLVKQVSTESRKFLPDWNITQFGGAVKDNTGTDMVVCTAAILNKRFKELVSSGFFKSFTGILADEAHTSSKSYANAMLSSSAYFRFSASDTTKEDNIEKNLLLTGLYGPIYGRMEANELISIDRIATPTIEVITCQSWRNKFEGLDSQPLPNTPAWALIDGTWMKGTYLGPAYELDSDGDFKLDRRNERIQIPGVHQIDIKDIGIENVESRWCLLERRYDRAITTFKERNDIIASKAKEFSKKGWPTLVIATRTLHVMILESIIKEKLGDLVKILYSTHSSEERDEAFEWLKSTPGSVLISPLLKVGVSIPALKGGIIADFVADDEVARQMIGRLIRRKPDGTENEAEVVMFSEIQHPSMAATSRRVLSRLKRVEGFKWKKTAL